MAIGSVSVTVVPDARGFPTKLKADLARVLKDVQVKVEADTTAAAAEIDKLSKDRSANVKVEADTAGANAEIDKVARDRRAKVTVDVDRSALDQASGLFTGFFSNLGLIPTLAIPATAALIPLAAAIGGVAAAVAAPALLAGGAVGLFAILGSAAVADTNKQLKLISTTETALGKLTQGTQAYTDKAKELKSLQHGLSDQAVEYQKSLADVKGAFDQLLQGKTGEALLGTIASGLELVAKVLPGLAPLIQAVGGAISSLIDAASKAVSGTGFTDFIATLSKTVGPDIVTFGHIIGNFVEGFVGLLTGLNDAFNKGGGGGVLGGLERLSEGFKQLGGHAGDSKWLHDFVDYFHKVGPPVASAAGSLARALGHIVKALAPIGPPVLGVIKGIADAISAIPVHTLTALAVTFEAMALLSGLGPAAVAIAAIAGAFTLLYQNSKPLRRVIKDLAGYFQDNLAPALSEAAHGALPQLASAFHDISRTIRQNHGLIVGFGKVLLTIGAANVVSNFHILAGGVRLIAAAFRIGVGAAHAWVDVVLSGAKFIVRAFALLANAVLTTFGDIVHGAAVAFGWIPGVGGKLKKADAAFQSFRGQASSALDGVAAHIQALQAKLDAVAKPRKITVTADTRSAIANLERLQRLQIANKSFTVTQITQHIERGVGPGGGIGHPSADGGLLRGPGGPRDDVLPVWASNGEYVVKAAAVAKYGVHMFDRLNAMSFADGGPVGFSLGNADVGGANSLRHLRSEAEFLKIALSGMKDQITKVTATLTKERAQRDKLIQARSALVSQTQDKFRSDLFGQTTETTTPGVAASDPVSAWLTNTLPTAATADTTTTTTTNPLDILKADVAHSQAFQATLKQLEAMGLHGGAETALAQSADPLAAAQQLLALGSGQVQQYQSLYAQRQQITHETGAFVGDQQYGAQIDKTNTEIDKTNEHLKRLRLDVHEVNQAIRETAQDIGDIVGNKINGAAHHARQKAQVRQA